MVKASPPLLYPRYLFYPGSSFSCSTIAIVIIALSLDDRQDRIDTELGRVLLEPDTLTDVVEEIGMPLFAPNTIEHSIVAQVH